MTKSAIAGKASGAQLRLRQLTKTFGAAKAVDQISLDVPAGAFVSLLGPSGSGKTTTLNLIAGFLTPDAGDILLDERSHRRRAAAQAQYRHGVPVLLAVPPHDRRRERRLSAAHAHQAVARGGTQARSTTCLGWCSLRISAARYPRQLSGGQQQRVAMARALVSHPRLLLMDEPLGALDKKLREQMQVEIKRIHRSVGTTVLYVTHDQAEALTHVRPGRGDAPRPRRPGRHRRACSTRRRPTCSSPISSATRTCCPRKS